VVCARGHSAQSHSAGAARGSAQAPAVTCAPIRTDDTCMTQDKPDFSGEWILNRQASALSPGADAVQSGVWRIEHHEPTFRHKAAFATEGHPIEYEYELLSDGREVVGTEQGARTVS